jgi:hypothetical protein
MFDEIFALQKQLRAKRVRRTRIAITAMAVICIVVFWVFMALKPAQAQGCGSSWAICKYRVWVRTHSPAEYQARQQRIARKCTPATVWKDACR